MIGIDDIVHRHYDFVKGLLNSRTMRDGYPTLAKMFNVMELQYKLCVRIIDRIEQDEFVLLDRYYGDRQKQTIYITHIPWHFFIAKLIDF